MKTQAEIFRSENAVVEYINGYYSEQLVKYPPASLMSPESNELTKGWGFPDGSEIWETWNGNSYDIYTTKI